MVKKITIKAKTLNGKRGLKEWLGQPSGAELHRNVISDDPYTIEVTTSGQVAEAMAKDGSKQAKIYIFFLKQGLKRFRIRNKKDYEVIVE